MSVELKPYSEMTEYERRSLGHTTHGHTHGGVYTPTYRSWQSMLARTRYKHRDPTAKYINRGISVCERWLSFENFLSDMGERPDGATLDRFPDKDGNYDPSNCRWATPREQARNTRRNKLNLQTATEVVLKRLQGASCLSLAAEYGISESLPREIAKGRTWPDALAAAKCLLDDRHD